MFHLSVSPKPGNELSPTRIKYSAVQFQMSSRLYHLYIHVYLITNRAKERSAMLVSTIVDVKSPYETIYKIVAVPTVTEYYFHFSIPISIHYVKHVCTGNCNFVEYTSELNYFLNRQQLMASIHT